MARCEKCGNDYVIGHGVEQNGRLFCCEHCARSAHSQATR